MLIHYYHSGVGRNLKMEYISKEYKHSIGKVCTTSDGH